MEDYPSNTNRSRESLPEKQTEKRVEKVVTGHVQRKKKTGAQRLRDTFIPEDVEEVKSYIFEDIVVPAVKDAIMDTVRAFLGVNGSASSRSSSAASKVSYRSYYNKNDYRDRSPSRPRDRFDYDDIIFKNRGEAEDVLSRMDELVETYGNVSVADFYDLAGIDDVPYTYNKYGWTDIRNASINRIRDGYLIKFPRATAI